MRWHRRFCTALPRENDRRSTQQNVSDDHETAKLLGLERHTLDASFDADLLFMLLLIQSVVVEQCIDLLLKLSIKIPGIFAFSAGEPYQKNIDRSLGRPIFRQLLTPC
jgi:hypothetical protein